MKFPCFLFSTQIRSSVGQVLKFWNPDNGISYRYKNLLPVGSLLCIILIKIFSFFSYIWGSSVSYILPHRFETVRKGMQLKWSKLQSHHDNLRLIRLSFCVPLFPSADYCLESRHRGLDKMRHSDQFATIPYSDSDHYERRQMAITFQSYSLLPSYAPLFNAVRTTCEYV